MSRRDTINLNQNFGWDNSLLKVLLSLDGSSTLGLHWIQNPGKHQILHQFLNIMLLHAGVKKKKGLRETGL
jgi:hypothetical protein